MAANDTTQDVRRTTMNKLTSKLLLAGLAVCLAAGPCLAAKDKAAADDGAPKVGRRLKKLTKRLDLDEKQAEKLQEAFQAQREAVQPIRKELREAMKNLREQVREEEADKEIKATLDRIKKLRQAMKAEHEKFQGKLETVLKPGQQAKMMLAMGKRGRRGGKGFRQGRGKGPRGMGRRHRRGGGQGWGMGDGRGRNRGWEDDY